MSTTKVITGNSFLDLDIAMQVEQNFLLEGSSPMQTPPANSFGPASATPEPQALLGWLPMASEHFAAYF